MSFLAVPVSGQQLTIGAIGGARWTGDVYRGFGNAESQAYLFGPSVQVGLPAGFGVQLDALYTRSGYSYFIPLIGNQATVRDHASVWEFPLMLQYRLPIPVVRPFLALGPTFRRVDGRTDETGYRMATINTSTTYASTRKWSAGEAVWSVGAGLDLGSKHIRITPQFRVALWRTPSRAGEDDVAYHFPWRQREVQALLGIGWRWK